MTKEEMITILKKAEKVFSLPPTPGLYNKFGLCYYFGVVHGLNPDEFYEVLGDKMNPRRYTISKHSQETLYRERCYDEILARRDWIRRRIVELGGEVEDENKVDLKKLIKETESIIYNLRLEESESDDAVLIISSPIIEQHIQYFKNQQKKTNKNWR